MQSTLLTGQPATGHGIVGNGWYFRELGEVFLWRQHNALVDGEKVWETARRAHPPGYRVANVCWWYAMGADVDFTVTPPAADLLLRRPQGTRLLHLAAPAARRTHRETRHVPAVHVLGGPTASLTSSRWIADAARHILATQPPT